MRSNNRGQIATEPAALYLAIVVAVSIGVGLNIITSMKTQLPDGGDVVLCGGCGYGFDILSPELGVVLVMFGVLVLARGRYYRNRDEE